MSSPQSLKLSVQDDNGDPVGWISLGSDAKVFVTNTTPDNEVEVTYVADTDAADAAALNAIDDQAGYIIGVRRPCIYLEPPAGHTVYGRVRRGSAVVTVSLGVPITLS